MRSMRLVLGAAGTLGLVYGSSIGAAIPPAADVDSIFADYDSTASPGCALGVMREGELIYRRGYGMANLEHGIALSPRSIFRTGSVGKQFTAMVVALLVERGILSLDDSLRTHFPEFPDYADQITLRHLIHHTSGLRDYLALTWLAGMDDDAHFSDEFVLELLARQKSLNFPPGERYLYSNSGYFLLSHVVRRATGETLREWAATSIFEPLGMADTHFHDDHTEIVTSRADGYAPTADGYRVSMTTLDMVGDGGVFTSIEDLLLWDRNFYDNRLGRGGAQLISLVTTPGTLADGEVLDYAFGLVIGEHRGLQVIAHGGAFVGFRAELIRFPEQRFSVAVLCNRSDADPGRRARQVAELYLADAMEPAEQSRWIATEELGTATSSPGELERIIGHYWSSEERSILEIRLQADTLLFDRGGEGGAHALAPLGPGRFGLVDPGLDATVRFEPIDGEARRMIVEIAHEEPRTFERFAHRTLGADALSRYGGTYYSDELDVEYVLEVVDGALVFGFNRPGDHRLEPQLDQVFWSRDYGILEFDLGRRGPASGFSLDADRVRNLQFVRRSTGD